MDKKTILIVDDNADTRLLLSVRLKANHYHTVFAADALQAISVALKEHPDAILLDLGLPGGNGLVVLQRFKANTSLGGIPVIIVTAEDPKVAEAAPSRPAQSHSFKSPWIKTSSWQRCSRPWEQHKACF